MKSPTIWEIGFIRPEAIIEDRGERFQVTLWLALRLPENKLIGQEWIRDEEQLNFSQWCEQLSRSPQECDPADPDIIHCSDEATAKSIAVFFPSARVQVGGTPYLNTVLRQMADRFHQFSNLRVEYEQLDAETIRKAGLDPENLELNAETQQKIAEAMMAGYYTGEWLDSPIQLLGGMTPRQAVASKEGVSAFYGLLHYMRQRSGHLSDGPMAVDENAICQALGIDPPPHVAQGEE